jgi:uncharacterized protein (TIRG00374 family)
MAWKERLDRLQETKAWSFARVLVGAIASAGLAWLVMRHMDWGEVSRIFSAFPVGWGLLGVVAIIASGVLRAYRWHVLLVREKISMWNLFLVQNAGIGANNLLPVRMLSEPIQLALATKRYGLSGPTALATLVVEHVLDVLATVILMALGVIFIPELRAVGIPLVGSAILFVVTLGVFLVVAKGIDTLPFVGRMGFMERFRFSLATIREHPTRVFISFLFTVAHWIALGVAGWALSHGLNMEVGLGAMVVLFLATTFFVSAVPSLPGGLGAFQFAMMLTLDLFGVPRSVSFTFSVAMHFVIFALPTVIALVVLPRAGMSLLGPLTRRRKPQADRTDSKATGVDD